MSNFPSALTTDLDLLIAVNNWTATLTNSITTTNVDIPISTAVGLQATDGLVSLGDEVILYSFIETSGGFVVLRNCTRGYDGTPMRAHASGTRVELRTVAAHHNRLSAAIRAIESALGTGILGGSASLTARLAASEPLTYTFSATIAWSTLVPSRGRPFACQCWIEQAAGVYGTAFPDIVQSVGSPNTQVTATFDAPRTGVMLLT
jgi:hypothetical protein